MRLKQISKWFVITGTLLIWLIKYILRPLDLFDEPVKFFLGIAPNLFGSFLVPFGAYWFFSGKNYLVARVFKIHTPYDLRLVCLMGFGLLILNEYLQRIPYFGRTFDYYDILFSLVGLVASHFTFGKIRSRERPEYRKQTN